MSAERANDCYVALELSQRTCLIGYLLPGSDNVQTPAVAGGNAEALLSALGRIESLAGTRNIRTGEGRQLARFIFRELCRQFERLNLVHSQLKGLEKELIQACETEGAVNCSAKIRVLKQLDGIGEVGATQLVAEVFHRTFKNRKHLASYLGLSPSTYSSGEVHRNQGISKAGNKLARVMLVELAWCWLKYQPQSQLTRWYRSRFSGA